MNRAELATHLVEAPDERERLALLESHAALADTSLAHTLKDICLEAWRGDPPRAVAARDALASLSLFNPSEEVAALAAWASGVASLVEGRMEEALLHLDDARARFESLRLKVAAASTQVSALIALAMLGRYDEAIETGLAARETFLAHGDLPAAGKVEQNIGNLCGRRDRYDEAKRYLTLARERFLAHGDLRQLAMIENSLALIHTLQFDFRAAEHLYRQARANAERAGLNVTLAEIEGSTGNLALFQGRYDRALELLESSRRRYASLGMSHQSAAAELELADAYLELNLSSEALSIYERVLNTFAELGMRAERARALAQGGRAAMLLGRSAEAHRMLSEARTLYAEEGNQVGEAFVTLTEAQLHYAEGDYATTAVMAAQAEAPLVRAGTHRRMLLARWLRAEAARAQGQTRLARILLNATLREAEEHALPHVAERCHTSLGLLASARGDSKTAAAEFERAVSLVEDLRAPLPAEEFRTAFVADKLTPYDELVRLSLARADDAGVRAAFAYTERARARALVEMMSGAHRPRSRPRDEFEARLQTEMDDLREELNWFYSRINRPPASAAGRPDEMQALNDAVREREARVLEIARQIRQRGGDSIGSVAPPEPDSLARALGPGAALVEYASLDGELFAFVLTSEGMEVVRRLARETVVEEAVRQFRFQVESLRHGAARLRSHLSVLTERARLRLAALYEHLLRPLEDRIGDRRLVVVPHRALHYVPFHALYDGEAHVIERREVSYAPSAGVLAQCLARAPRTFERALLVGVSDERAPRVRDEIETLAPLFDEATTLLDERATLGALRERAPSSDVVHLACHGRFRPDSPLFSSLKLGDGWLTARDAYSLDLRAPLVTLSACETGVNEIAPGDELIGLVRGFFSAGASALILSLWTVDDEATADTMRDFYAALRAGRTPAQALRAAQLAQLRERPHPFFWSPFVLMGRW